MIELTQLYQVYKDAFPDHPGFDVTRVTPNSPQARLAVIQMLWCLKGKRSAPVTNKSIELSFFKEATYNCGITFRTHITEKVIDCWLSIATVAWMT